MSHRHNQSHIEAWKTTGFLLIPDFFTKDEIAPIALDYERLYEQFRPQSSHAVDFKGEGQIGAFHGKQFLHTEPLPFDAGPEMNLLSLHPRSSHSPKICSVFQRFTSTSHTVGQNLRARRITIRCTTAISAITR